MYKNSYFEPWKANHHQYSFVAADEHVEHKNNCRLMCNGSVCSIIVKKSENTVVGLPRLSACVNISMTWMLAYLLHSYVFTVHDIFSRRRWMECFFFIYIYFRPNLHSHRSWSFFYWVWSFMFVHISCCISLAHLPAIWLYFCKCYEKVICMWMWKVIEWEWERAASK